MPGSADIEQLFDLQYVIPEDLVTCKLCSEVFKSPHTLPCLHTFCRTCLEVEQISHDAGNKTIACPTCDYGCKLDCVQEQTPRTNFFLAGLADSFWELRCKGSTLSKHQCALCTEKLCVIACGGCSLRMCSKCALSHISKNPPRDHRLFRLEEGSMSLMNDDAVRPHRDEKISCRHHPDNQIQSFCCTCNVPTCTKCVMEDHGKPGHEISFMAGVARMKQQDLKQAMKLLKTQAKFINKGILAAKTEADKITEHSAKAESKIDSHAENLIAQIMNMKELAKNKVRDLVQLKTNILKNQINELEKRVAAIQSTEKFANALLKYANPAEYLTSEDTLCNRVLQLVNEAVQYTPKETGDVIFEVDEAPVQHGFGILRSTSVSGDNSTCTRVKTVFRVGEEQKVVIATRNRENEIVAAYNSVTAEIAYPSGKTKELDVEHNLDDLSHTVKFCCLDEGKYLLKVNVGGFPLNGSPFTVKVVPQEGTFKEFGGFGDTIMDTPPSIEGVAINLQNHAVLADKTNHQLQILDSLCNYAGSVEFPNLSKPFSPNDIAVSDNGQCFVADDANKEVVVWSERDEVTRAFGKGKLSCPKSLALTKDGYVLVTDWQVLTRKHCIKKLTRDGNCVKVINSNNRTFTKPSSVRVNSKNQMIVSDTQNHRVVVMTVDGTLISSFGSRGSKDGQLISPRGIDIDDNDDVYVCDYGNDRISQYDSRGNFIRHAVKLDVTKPIRVAVTKYGPRRIVVTMDTTEPGSSSSAAKIFYV